MLLTISREKTIFDMQHDFSAQYPFLKLEFYKMQDADPSFLIKKHLVPSVRLRSAGLRKQGSIEIKDEMTVADLEKAFQEDFGLDVQVSRKSGVLWLQTSMTDNWTLQKQNEYGREMSVTRKPFVMKDPDEGQD